MSVSLIYLDEADKLWQRASEQFKACECRKGLKCTIPEEHFALWDHDSPLDNLGNKKQIHDATVGLEEIVPDGCEVCHAVMLLRMSDIFLRSAYVGLEEVAPERPSKQDKSQAVIPQPD